MATARSCTRSLLRKASESFSSSYSYASLDAHQGDVFEGRARVQERGVDTNWIAGTLGRGGEDGTAADRAGRAGSVQLDVGHGRRPIEVVRELNPEPIA